MLNESGCFERVETFKTPATNRSPKVYVVKYCGDIVYVGTAQQSFGARLWLGLTAKGKGGYHGYKWRGLPGKIDVLIYCLEMKGKPEKQKKKLETIEAEIVFAVRSLTGKWPKYQTEIHFHNASKSELQIAHHILAVG